MPARSWSTHQLAEFLAAVSAYEDERAAVLGAVERAAAALEAEVAAMVRDDSVVAAIGFPAGEVPEDVLVEAAQGRELREIPGLGRCRAATARLEGEPGGALVLARLGDEEFDPPQISLLQAMARVLALSLRGLRMLVAERRLRQRAENEAAERHKAERRLATQHSVARVLADAASAEGAYVPVLRTLARELECVFGALWLVEGDSLLRAAVWQATPEAGSLAQPPSPAPGEGPVGRAWMQAAPAWETRPASAASGVEAVLAIPIAAGPEVTGVVELVRGEHERPDPALLEMLAGVGTQIGQFLNRRVAEERLAHQALHDALTGLPNRTLLLDRVEHALAAASRTGRSVAVLFLDIDRFKLVNDSLGHDAGDRLLLAFAQRLTSVVRASDTIARAESTVARLGGDEFVVLCEDLRRERDAVRIAERIADGLREPLTVDGAELTMTASVGIVVSGHEAGSAEHLIRDADLAMYRAKDGGGDRYELFDTAMRTRVLQRIELERDLRTAVDRGELRLHYQPIVSVQDGAMVAAEALLRWEHPRRGLVSPGEFVPIAEESGLIVSIGEWTLRTACRQLADWRRAGLCPPGFSLAVNISVRQLGSNLTETVADALRANDVEPPALSLEITESLLMEAAESSVDPLGELRSLGVRVVLDDFGTGYSSFSYLQRFELDGLKLDRSFVSSLGRDPRSSKLVAATTNLAGALGLGLVAEGVETEDQLRFLRELRCPHAQGYLFARPAPPENLERSLEGAAQPADMAAAARSASSSGGTSSTWVATSHRWPKGSSN